MEKTDRVEIKGPGTDLRFSIKGIGAIICGGDRNIPDGEVFSCPVQGLRRRAYPLQRPDDLPGHRLRQHPARVSAKGKSSKATANETEKLNKILDSDPGARYIGEFSLGFNPYILHPMRDILFDEKIAGSFHFTPGQAYEEADNGNRSQVHWDMVNIQRPDYGGGEIYFDGKADSPGRRIPAERAAVAEPRQIRQAIRRSRPSWRPPKAKTARGELRVGRLSWELVAAALTRASAPPPCGLSCIMPISPLPASWTLAISKTGAPSTALGPLPGNCTRHVLRSRVQDDRRDLEGRRKLHGRDLEAGGDVHRSLPLLRRRELDRRRVGARDQLQPRDVERGRTDDAGALLLRRSEPDHADACCLEPARWQSRM